MVDDLKQSARAPLGCVVLALALLVSPASAGDQRKTPGADASGSPKKAKPKFELRDGDRVVFLGNTLIEREQQYGYWETMLTARYPDRKILFRNLGWDGDTVWAESRGLFDPPEKGYARMLAHVGRIKPTVLFLGYGNNEAFAGQPGLPRFVKQYNKLLDDLTRVSAKGVRFVLLSPVFHEVMPPPMRRPDAINVSILDYAEAIKGIATKRDALYIELSDPNQSVHVFPTGIHKLRHGLTSNGIHWTRKGYANLAIDIDTKIGIENVIRNDAEELDYMIRPFQVVIATNRAKVLRSRFCRVSNLQVGKDTVKFALQSAHVQFPIRKGDNAFVSTYFANSVEIRDLPSADWELRIDGKRVATKVAFINGVVKVKLPRWTLALDFASSETLRQAIIAKNRLYFHSWRPQNVTYLFLFRKHEQGQNAKEMQEFEWLVAAKEKEIDRLKKPVTRTYELVRVKAEKK